jgi:DNA replicative helicase MCM subunit Mcm2 (Cdc46/Mcm family)
MVSKKNIRVNGHASEKDKIFSIIQALKHSKENTLTRSEIRKVMNEKYDMPEYEVDDLIKKLCSKGVIYSPVSDKFKCA